MFAKFVHHLKVVTLWWSRFDVLSALWKWSEMSYVVPGKINFISEQNYLQHITEN